MKKGFSKTNKTESVGEEEMDVENMDSDAEEIGVDIENIDTGEEEVSAPIDDMPNRSDGAEEFDVEMEDNGEEALKGGLGDGASPADFDPRQILLGMEVEMEHTHTPQEALEIALDHLTENPNYYGNEGDDPEMEAQDNAAEDAAEIEDEVIGTETEVEDENPESMENDDLSVNMNWLETLKPNKVGDMEI